MPNPKKITVRQLGQGQTDNMNKCKVEAINLFQQATMIYQTCIAGLFRANFEVSAPLIQINLDSMQHVKVEITLDD